LAEDSELGDMMATTMQDEFVGTLRQMAGDAPKIAMPHPNAIVAVARGRKAKKRSLVTGVLGLAFVGAAGIASVVQPFGSNPVPLQPAGIQRTVVGGDVTPIATLDATIEDVSTPLVEAADVDHFPHNVPSGAIVLGAAGVLTLAAAGVQAHLAKRQLQL
jgi:hypothetical protein